MTNAQKWVAAFLGLFVVLFVLSKVVEKDDTAIPENIEKFMQEDTEADAGQISGLTLIERHGCASCHGEDLKGKEKLGPGLYKVKQHWDKDGLVNYLRNPSDFDSDSRFDEYEKQFGNVMMPSYENIDVKDLGKMAEYLLSLEEK